MPALSSHSLSAHARTADALCMNCLRVTSTSCRLCEPLVRMFYPTKRTLCTGNLVTTPTQKSCTATAAWDAQLSNPWCGATHATSCTIRVRVVLVLVCFLPSIMVPSSSDVTWGTWQTVCELSRSLWSGVTLAMTFGAAFAVGGTRYSNPFARFVAGLVSWVCFTVSLTNPQRWLWFQDMVSLCQLALVQLTIEGSNTVCVHEWRWLVHHMPLVVSCLFVLTKLLECPHEWHVQGTVFFRESDIIATIEERWTTFMARVEPPPTWRQDVRSTLAKNRHLFVGSPSHTVRRCGLACEVGEASMLRSLDFGFVVGVRGRQNSWALTSQGIPTSKDRLPRSLRKAVARVGRRVRRALHRSTAASSLPHHRPAGGALDALASAVTLREASPHGDARTTDTPSRTHPQQQGSVPSSPTPDVPRPSVSNGGSGPTPTPLPGGRGDADESSGYSSESSEFSSDGDGFSIHSFQSDLDDGNVLERVPLPGTGVLLQRCSRFFCVAPSVVFCPAHTVCMRVTSQAWPRVPCFSPQTGCCGDWTAG